MPDQDSNNNSNNKTLAQRIKSDLNRKAAIDKAERIKKIDDRADYLNYRDRASVSAPGDEDSKFSLGQIIKARIGRIGEDLVLGNLGVLGEGIRQSRRAHYGQKKEAFFFPFKSAVIGSLAHGGIIGEYFANKLSKSGMKSFNNDPVYAVNEKVDRVAEATEGELKVIAANFGQLKESLKKIQLSITKINEQRDKEREVVSKSIEKTNKTLDGVVKTHREIKLDIASLKNRIQGQIRTIDGFKNIVEENRKQTNRVFDDYDDRITRLEEYLDGKDFSSDDEGSGGSNEENNKNSRKREKRKKTDNRLKGVRKTERNRERDKRRNRSKKPSVLNEPKPITTLSSRDNKNTLSSGFNPLLLKKLLENGNFGGGGGFVSSIAKAIPYVLGIGTTAALLHGAGQAKEERRKRMEKGEAPTVPYKDDETLLDDSSYKWGGRAARNSSSIKNKVKGDADYEPDSQEKSILKSDEKYKIPRKKSPSKSSFLNYNDIKKMSSGEEDWKMHYERQKNYEDKKSFMLYGKLPGGFEFAPGHMGRLGTPDAVAATGAMPLQGGGGGSYGGYSFGGSSSGSGYSGGGSGGSYQPPSYSPGRGSYFPGTQGSGVQTRSEQGIPFQGGTVSPGNQSPSGTWNTRSDIPYNGIPASIRYNNPGASYNRPKDELYGIQGYGIIGGGHRIGRYSTPVHGLASNMDLFSTSKNYLGQSLGKATSTWRGGNTGPIPSFTMSDGTKIDANTIITPELVKNKEFMTKVFRQYEGVESGKKQTLTDDQINQAFLMKEAGGIENFKKMYPDFQPQEKSVPRQEIQKLNPSFNQTGLNVRDISNISGVPSSGQMEGVKGLVVHHTAGPNEQKTSDVTKVLRNKGLGYQYIMERDGSINRVVAEGSQASHVRPGGTGSLGERGRGFGNQNLEGISLIAKGDKDITPEQISALKKFQVEHALKYGYDPLKTTFGHGELNEHKINLNEGQNFLNQLRTPGEYQKWVDDYKKTQGTQPQTSFSSESDKKIENGKLIVFRGLQGQIDENSVRRIAQSKGLEPVFFNHTQSSEALEYIKNNGIKNYETLGFSAGVRTQSQFLSNAKENGLPLAQNATSIGQYAPNERYGQYSNAGVPTRHFVDSSGKGLSQQAGIQYYPGSHMPNQRDPGIMAHVAQQTEIRNKNVPNESERIFNRVIENQGSVAATRRLPIKPELREYLDYAANQSGVHYEVTSGGQHSRGPRTGTNRHNVDNPNTIGAADGKMFVIENGQKRYLSIYNPADREKIEKFTESFSSIAPGAGIGTDYMGSGSQRGQLFHFGGPNQTGGSPVAYAGPDFFREAHRRGTSSFRNEEVMKNFVQYKTMMNNPYNSSQNKPFSSPQTMKPMTFLADQYQQKTGNEPYLKGITGNQGGETPDFKAWQQKQLAAPNILKPPVNPNQTPIPQGVATQATLAPLGMNQKVEQSVPSWRRQENQSTAQPTVQEPIQTPIPQGALSSNPVPQQTPMPKPEPAPQSPSPQVPSIPSGASGGTSVAPPSETPKEPSQQQGGGGEGGEEPQQQSGGSSNAGQPNSGGGSPGTTTGVEVPQGGGKYNPETQAASPGSSGYGAAGRCFV